MDNEIAGAMAPAVFLSATPAMLLGLVSLTATVLSAWLIARLLRACGPVDAMLFYVPVFCAHILLAGFALSALNALDRLDAWAAAGGVMLMTALIVYAVLKLPLQWPRMPSWKAFIRRFSHLESSDKRLIAPLLFTVIVLALVNFDLVRNTAPHNWDSMTYHLARMAYYLQHGNLSAYDANYWAQVTHPKNSTILTLYTYLSSGSNENLTQLVQFAAYGVATVAVYGICRRLGRDRSASLFAACIFALLTECLMQATTTQNDMTLTAFIGIVTYALLAYRERRHHRYLLVAGLSTGIMLGIKSSVLLAGPSLAIIALYALMPRVNFRPARQYLRSIDLKSFAVLGTALIASAVALALPSGYLENMRLFGSPIGTDYVRKLHSFEGEPLASVLTNGTRNLFRFGFDFLSLDGLPPGGAIMALQQTIRRIPVELSQASGLDLETKEATRAPFQYDKAPTSHEDGSYWGVFGFALIWPLALLGLITRRVPSARVLALAAFLFILAQAYSGPYDPWRGRYFIIAAMFAAPLVAWSVHNPHPLWRAYLTVIVLLGCLSAFTGVLGRVNDMPEVVYDMDRLQQITRNRPSYTDAIRRFGELVPQDAMVALYFGEDTFEYPLFGPGLTRTLLPINAFWRGAQPIPSNAGYLLYSSDLYTDRRGGDIHLGEDWYLRDLNKP